MKCGTFLGCILWQGRIIHKVLGTTPLYSRKRLFDGVRERKRLQQQQEQQQLQPEQQVQQLLQQPDQQQLRQQQEQRLRLLEQENRLWKLNHKTKTTA
ncbi:MAG: hypothetical protein ACJ71D_06440 [Nitrososphaera sp.]